MNSDSQLNSDSDLVCFIFLIIGVQNKLTKQLIKIQMRRLIRIRLIWISNVYKCMSEFS